LHDIDMLKSHCIKPAVAYAYEAAKLLEAKNDKLYKSMPYPWTVGNWLNKVCS